MVVTVNGKETDLSDALTIMALLQSKRLASETVVVELNQQIIPTEQFEEIRLNDGDHLEILRFVGGG